MGWHSFALQQADLPALACASVSHSQRPRSDLSAVLDTESAGPFVVPRLSGGKDCPPAFLGPRLTMLV